MADLATQLRDYLEATAPEVLPGEARGLQAVRPGPASGSGRSRPSGRLGERWGLQSRPMPGERQPRVRGVLVAAMAMVLVLATVVPLWLVFHEPRWRVLPGATNVTYPPAPAGKTPMASAEELVEVNYAALTNKDTAALRSVNVEGAIGLIYLVDQSQVGRIAGTIDAGYDPAEDIDQAWQVLGDFTRSGNVVAIPMRVEYPSEGAAIAGFDVWLLERFQSGLLCAGGVTFGAFEPFVAANPTVVEALLADQREAWEQGDMPRVLDDFAATAIYLNGFFRGGADGLSGFFAGISLEYTGEAALSGPFVAIPTRITSLATGVATEGISIYWIRDGEIALYAFSPGI